MKLGKDNNIRIRIPYVNITVFSALNSAHDPKLNLNRNLVKLSHLEVKRLELKKHLHNLSFNFWAITTVLLHIPHAQCHCYKCTVSYS